MLFLSNIRAVSTGVHCDCVANGIWNTQLNTDGTWTAVFISNKVLQHNSLWPCDALAPNKWKLRISICLENWFFLFFVCFRSLAAVAVSIWNATSIFPGIFFTLFWKIRFCLWFLSWFWWSCTWICTVHNQLIHGCDCARDYAVIAKHASDTKKTRAEARQIAF